MTHTCLLAAWLGKKNARIFCALSFWQKPKAMLVFGFYFTPIQLDIIVHSYGNWRKILMTLTTESQCRGPFRNVANRTTNRKFLWTIFTAVFEIFSRLINWRQNISCKFFWLSFWQISLQVAEFHREDSIRAWHHDGERCLKSLPELVSIQWDMHQTEKFHASLTVRSRVHFIYIQGEKHDEQIFCIRSLENTQL